MTIRHNLKKQGLCNDDQDDFGNVQCGVRTKSMQMVRRAYCNSEACSPKNVRGRVHDGTKKVPKTGVKPSDFECPDCGDCLFWESERI
jgi:hypothetical protein